MEIESEIKNIQKRNAKVEAEKAWETSLLRKICIVTLTYITVSFLLWYLDFERPFISSIIPCIGYILSTFSLGFLREKYIEKYIKKGGK